ncbi:unnamed protein product [Dracunculus medinensis]|uniref:BPI2 domain-containing protein n=1 Tax=Dracunculus medinensis TaxID=318479 RepID=A0A0N4UGV6_DRAME|nr:unnamed protein product [Dracunculus medinensis]
MGNEYYGSATLIIKRAIVELMFAAAINSDGHLRNELEYCKIPNSQVHLNYTAIDAVTILCSNFIVELMPIVANHLLNTPLSAALFDYYFLNYGLVEPIQYLNDSILLKHRGNTFGILRKGNHRFNDFRLPYRTPQLQIPSSNGGMVDFYLSNYTISSLFFWMDQYRKFDYEVSAESMNNSLSGYLRTECNEDEICAGTLFPALAVQFPKGIVKINTYTTTYPRISIRKDQATVSLWSRIDAHAQQINRTNRFLTAGMFAELVFKKPTFINYTFNANLEIIKFKVFGVVSGIAGVDATSLEFLVGALNELIIAEDVAKKLQNGITMPIVFDLPQKSSQVTFENGRIQISVDFRLENESYSVAESKDEDYYDNI